MNSMRFHYLLYFEAEEYTFQNPYSPEEPLNSSLTKNFISSSLYKLQNQKIFDRLEEELIDIIQDINVIEFFKIELNLNLNNSHGFKFFILHFTSSIEMYHHIGEKYLPIGNEADNLLNKISSRLNKIQEIIQTSRFLVNTYIPPNLREDIWGYIKDTIQNSEQHESLMLLGSLHKYPYIIEFQHNFSHNFDEVFTKQIEKYITDVLSIDQIYWDVHVLDYSNRGILRCPDEKIDFEKVSDLLSDRLVQNIYGIYIRISAYLRYNQQKLMNLDEILSNLNYSEFLSNLKLLKFNTFGEFPLLYLQEIDRILLRTSEDSAERLDPPMSEIFDNPAFGYNIYDKIQSNYTSLKEELNSTLTTLQIILSQNHKDIIKEEPTDEEVSEKVELVEQEKPDEGEEYTKAFTSTLISLGYRYLEPLGKSGSWADLYLVFSQDEREIRVAKVYGKALSKISKENFESDANKLKRIDHINVVKVFNKGYFKIKDIQYFFLIMEYIRGQDFSEVNSQIFFEVSYITRLKYFDQALDGINEFRKNFILHHDLHGRNIMITDVDYNNKRRIVIIDPGYSRYSYDPGDEDIDLFSIKEEFFYLFLKPEEKTTITEGVTLNELEFPEIRRMIKDLIRQEEKKLKLGSKLKELEDNVSKVKQTKEGSLEYIIEILRTSHPKVWSYDDSYGIFTYNINVELNIRIREDIPGNGEPFEEDWTNVFVNPSAYKLIAKVYYRGSFVKDYLLVYVDGHRNILPVPKTAVDLRISTINYNLGKILNCRHTPNLDYNLKEYDIKLNMARIVLDKSLD